MKTRQKRSQLLFPLCLSIALAHAVRSQDAAPADRGRARSSARPGDMMADSPVKFPERGALPAKYPPDLKVRNEPAENGYYIFSSPCRSLKQMETIQAEMPEGAFSTPRNDWKHLRRTRRLLVQGGELRIVALGDSIVNDTMRSGWVGRLEEAYPASRIRTTVYVRGGGGCQHFREEDRIARNVVSRRPDLVLIGGISQRDIGDIREVIHQLRAGLPEVEVLLFSGSFGTADPRNTEALARARHSGTGAYGVNLRALAVEERCAYLDMTTPWAEYIVSSGLHPHRFYRDVVHANEYGEQILCKIMMAFWASQPRSPSAEDAATGDAVASVLGVRNLVAFWTFGEPAGQPRLSTGTRERYPLEEVGGPIKRVEGGPFSGYSAELNGRQYFRIPYSETGDLNICGPKAQVSMVAVVRIENLRQSRTIAGMWSEGKGAHDDTGTRQYALLMNMPAYGGPRRLTPHISSEGGVTRRADGSAFPWCVDYAATRKEVPESEWCTLGFTYDGEFIRAYINGTLDARSLDPAKDRRADRYFTREGPGGGDRGMNPYYHGRGIFCYDAGFHAQTKPGGGSDFTVGARYAVGSMLGEATIGRFGGLAVFDRALSDAEMKRLHDAARIATLPDAPASEQ